MVAIYGHGGHLGLVTITIHINVHSSFPCDASHENGLQLTKQFPRSLKIVDGQILEFTY